VAHEELVRLDKDKTELILNISHELKTPLTSIIGFASLIPTLELTGETESLLEFLGFLENSASHLNYLVERILELFRLEAGRVPAQLERAPLVPGVDAAIQELTSVLDGRKVVQDMGGLEEVLFLNDNRLFTRAMELLLENAVKFSTGETPIEISGQWHENCPDVPTYAVGKDALKLPTGTSGWIQLTVRDHGRGMREKDIPLIFEKFKQLGDIMTDKPEGIGLGLSIARAIMERHHGALWADLAIEGGTRLHLLFAGQKGDQLDDQEND
jgi:signal transduction histidine kinase